MTSINNIKKLRELTGAGVSDCKKALEETAGNIDKAIEILKKKGLEKADKKSERETHQGKVFSYIHSTGKVGVLLALLCETDFVAKTDEFNNLGRELCLQVAAMQPETVEDLLKQDYIRDGSQTVETLIKLVIGKLGENIKINEVKWMKL
ncbi:MAG: translation elongation factor Ts [bacterium]|nr:translation elongation factor Ts [bacterium]